MNNQSAWDREEDQLQRDLDRGYITQKEFNKAMSDLRRDYRDAAQDAAQGAYDSEMQNW